MPSLLTQMFLQLWGRHAVMNAAIQRSLHLNFSHVQELGSDMYIEKSIEQESAQTAVGNGCGILLTAMCEEGLPIMGAAGLGERGVPAEAVGEKAARELAEDIATGSCVDRW